MFVCTDTFQSIALYKLPNFSRSDYINSMFFFFFQAEDGIRDLTVTGVQTCALPISVARAGLRVELDHLLALPVRPIARAELNLELVLSRLDRSGARIQQIISVDGDRKSVV